MACLGRSNVISSSSGMKRDFSTLIEDDISQTSNLGLPAASHVGASALHLATLGGHLVFVQVSVYFKVVTRGL